MPDSLISLHPVVIPGSQLRGPDSTFPLAGVFSWFKGKRMFEVLRFQYLPFVTSATRHRPVKRIGCGCVKAKCLLHTRNPE
jgi:hypothetical protein